jgi:hypothetical protein
MSRGSCKFKTMDTSDGLFTKGTEGDHMITPQEQEIECKELSDDVNLEGFSDELETKEFFEFAPNHGGSISRIFNNTREHWDDRDMDPGGVDVPWYSKNKPGLTKRVGPLGYQPRNNSYYFKLSQNKDRSSDGMVDYNAVLGTRGGRGRPLPPPDLSKSKAQRDAEWVEASDIYTEPGPSARAVKAREQARDLRRRRAERMTEDLPDDF